MPNYEKFTANSHFSRLSLPAKIFLIIFLLATAYIWTSISSAHMATEWGWNIDNSKMTTMRLSQMVSVPLLTLILLAIVNVGSILPNRNRKLLAALYLSINLVLFILVAPGCLTSDTYYTFSHMVKNGWWEGWYSALHPIIITSLIQIIPLEFYAPGIFLALIWSATYVFAHTILSKLSAPRIMHICLFLLSFAPAQLASSLIIIRDSYFTAIFIFFVLYIFYLKKIKINVSLYDFLALMTIGSILSFYRSDALPAVILGVFLFSYSFLLKNSGVSIARKLIPAIAIPFVLIFFISSSPSIFLNNETEKGDTWGNRTEKEYKLTLIENPLGYIARNNGAISEEQKINIEKVFLIEDLSRYWCPQNLCVFWGGFWNKDSSITDRQSAFNSALAVFFQNPKLFILARLETLATVGDTNSQTTCSMEKMKDYGFSRLFEPNSLTEAGDLILGFIRSTETKEGALGGKMVWWNIYLSTFIFLVVLFFFKLSPISAIISLILLVRSLVVFLAAPAGFTVYYTTSFIGAPLVLMLFLCEAKKKLNQPPVE